MLTLPLTPIPTPSRTPSRTRSARPFSPQPYTLGPNPKPDPSPSPSPTPSQALRRGRPPAALPRMQLEALLVVARIGSGVAAALLGEAHPNPNPNPDPLTLALTLTLTLTLTR